MPFSKSHRHFRLLIVGGGSGGSAIAAKFSRLLPNPRRQIAIVEPQEYHFYQPGLTFVGAGLLRLEDIRRKEVDVLPKKVGWVKEQIANFQPKENSVTLGSGEQLSYDFLLIATGLELRFDLVEGLNEEVLLRAPGICSIYHPQCAEKTQTEIRNFRYGDAIFTFPNTPIKCAGAPQKIAYLAEEQMRRAGTRKDARILFNTSLGKIFGVEKYACSLMQVVKERGIELNTRHNLRTVDVERQVAIFELLDDEAKPTGTTKNFAYSLLHIGPPCSPVKALRDSASREGDDGLVDAGGWVDVNAKTMQSRRYPNIFALGDCTNSPNAKTVAAISSQFKAVKKNLFAAMQDKKPSAEYDGYASCPLVIDRSHVILAEFNSAGPMETFPWDQSRPSRLFFLMKRYLMPWLYWNMLVTGRWNGPATMRRFFNTFKWSKQN